jgi:hypothetical protein
MAAIVGPSIAQSYSHERTKTPTVTRLLYDPISSSLIDANSCFVYHQSIMLSCIPIHLPKEIGRGEWRDDHEGRGLWRTSTCRGLHALLCLSPDPRPGRESKCRNCAEPLLRPTMQRCSDESDLVGACPAAFWVAILHARLLEELLCKGWQIMLSPLDPGVTTIGFLISHIELMIF